ncbi:hypothetical protein P3T37_003242 [Kitasatospora sp. MAA4]|uniref:hypothetical protein n=1 Tax=Kitasatospora sp. MAA4 TaxID=3035093 RepID=UPI00247414CF|nr:hypothetical protein [Kitasatospora sp. MAA4]MDH6133843.1 hypothetical protein [Kitasatospora sp. MAA4]
MSSSTDRTVGHDSTALDEIDLAGELMIAATASADERLPTARIDEVLLSGPEPDASEAATRPGPAQPGPGPVG